MLRFDPFCISAFLAFRYIPERGRGWTRELVPTWPSLLAGEQLPVKTAADVLQVLPGLVQADANTGILLSGGIDSAILASYLPRGAKAYTIRFIAEGAVDESEAARVYAEHCGLELKVVEVHWQDYLESSDRLMRQKRAPLHAIEVALYKAGLAARADGLSKLLVGNGADSTFGGMDKLLSKDWTYAEFVTRYTFMDPAEVLEEPVDLSAIWQRYGEGDRFDVQRFLKEVHGIGIIQTFENGAQCAGVSLVEPYEKMVFAGELDISRIRAGESKYVLRSVFKERYPTLAAPAKIPFARPMDQWLKNWSTPAHRVFRRDYDFSRLSGEQKWIVWCLDRFLGMHGAA